MMKAYWFLAAALLGTLVVSLALTLMAELLVAWVLGIRTRGDLGVVAAVNAVTNPLVVFCACLTSFFWSPQSLVHQGTELLAEVMAVIAEALLYRRFLAKRKPGPWMLSLLLNGASYGLGLALSLVI